MEKNIIPEVKIGKYQSQKLPFSISAFELFKRMYPHAQNCFLLESLGEEGKYNRYSYIGFNPEFVVSAKGNTLMCDGKSETYDNPYFVLAQYMRQKFKKSDFGTKYCGGLVGYVSYEGTAYFEDAFGGFEQREFHDFQFGFYTDGIVYDKKTKTCSYFHHGKNRIQNVYSFLHGSGHLERCSVKTIGQNKKESEHTKMVLQAKEHIKRGDIFQVVLSVKTQYQILGDIRKIYAVLRKENPAPYMTFLRFKDQHVITASPELLISTKGKDLTHLGTLAGTIHRGANKKEDDVLAYALQHNEKEMAEHMMLVDLARSDVGKICTFGSVKVNELAHVKHFSHVSHLHSEVKGELTLENDCFSALPACFPAGTVSGAPKVEAMKILKQLEGEARGPYAGVAGYISLTGNSMFAIAIRSLFISGEMGFTQTGSGIVADSDPHKEYIEITNKQKAMEATLSKV